MPKNPALANKERPHIALFMPNLRTGGAERAMVYLAQGFYTAGIETDFVLVKADGQFLTHLPRQIKIVDLNLRSTYLSLVPLIGYLRSANPDVVISGLDLTNLMLLFARRICGLPGMVVVSLQNTVSMHPRKRIKKLLERFLLARVYPWADEIIAVSRGVAEDFSSYTGIPLEMVRVIHNPVIIPGLEERCRTPVDHPWLEPGQPPLILGVGRLTYQKNFELLIRAFSQVQHRLHSRLLILGEGEARPALEALVAELGLGQYVSMPGNVENPQAYMSKAGVMVLSSRSEGLPTVLIEAMACGCPVISTDCPSGPHEILDGGRFGFLVPPGDREKLAQAIERSLAGETPKPTREWLDQFELDQVIEQYLQVTRYNSD